MKCITLEHPDGNISTRGGLGTRSLARFCLAVQTGEDPAQVAQPRQKAAVALLASLSLAEIEAGRDLGLQFILDVLVPKDNPGLVARIEDIEFPADKTFRPAWRRGVGRIDIDLPKARDIQEARITEARRVKARDILERETMGEDVTADRAALQAINARPQIDAAQTPEALSAVWPAGLPRP